MKTIINSNGSKWFGQKPDSINKLIEVLKDNTIESSFFFKFKKSYDGKTFQWVVGCPIQKETLLDGSRNKHYTFFVNFEEVSQVFNIETSDQKIITKLKNAIMKNAGWNKYIGVLKKKGEFK